MVKIVYSAPKLFFIVVGDDEKVIDSLDIIKDAVMPVREMYNFNVFDNIIHLTVHTVDWKKRKELFYGCPGGVLCGGGAFRQAYEDFESRIEQDLKDFDKECK